MANSHNSKKTVIKQGMSDLDIIRYAEENNVTGISSALAEGVNVNTVEGKTGITALHAACANNHLESVQLLLKDSSIDLDIRDKFGRTAVDVALKVSDPQIMSELLSVQQSMLPDADM